MDQETRARQAKALQANKYLRFLFDERADEIREEWENSEPGEAETRELKFRELRTLNDMRDFIYARISADTAGDGGT